MLSYFRQKEHIKFQAIVSLLIYFIILCHLLIAALFIVLRVNLDQSLIIRDMGDSIATGCGAIVNMLIIFCLMLVAITLFVQRSSYLLEKHLYLRYIIITLLIVGVANFAVMATASQYYDTIQLWIDQQCKSEPLNIPLTSWSDHKGVLPFSFSKWQDYDHIYQLNDYVASTKACNATDPE